MEEELYPYTTEDEVLDIPSRPLYLVLNDQSEVADLSFEDTGHHYQDVPEERDLDYWREFFELKSHRLTFIDGLLVSEPRQTAIVPLKKSIIMATHTSANTNKIRPSSVSVSPRKN